MDDTAGSILQEKMECYTNPVKYILWDGSNAEIEPGAWLSLKEFELAYSEDEEWWADSVQYAQNAKVGWRAGRKGKLIGDWRLGWH